MYSLQSDLNAGVKCIEGLLEGFLGFEIRLEVELKELYMMTSDPN
jgi:hypothetical protein